MATEIMAIKLHSVEDKMPDMDNLTGRVAYIWDGCVVSGWPIGRYDEDGNRCGYMLQDGEVMWEPSEDRHGGPVVGVTHWIEFPEPVWALPAIADRDEPYEGEGYCCGGGIHCGICGATP